MKDGSGAPFKETSALSDLTTLADRVADHVGGPDNVTRVSNCTTRLRFIVRDKGQVDLEALNETPGVLKAVDAGGQIQVVIGTHVADVLQSLLKLPGWGSLGQGGEAAESPKRSPLDVVFDFLGSTFQPLIPAITGAAMVQVIAILLTQFGGLDPKTPTALILNATGNAIFYFLPILVAYTASRKLEVNPFVGAIIAAALLHPSFMEIGEAGTVAEAFGLPLFMYSYASSMFPALLAALALGGLDRLLKRVVPRALQQVVNPTIELLLLVPLTALVFGPIGVVVGSAIGSGVAWLSSTVPFLFYLIVPALWIFLVALGIHWALITIAIADLAATGATVIGGAAMGYQYSIMGIAIAMLIKVARDKHAKSLRDTAAAATLAVTIGGITEPTIYGLVLRYRRVLVFQMITAAAAGAVLGLSSMVMIGFSPAPILSLPLMKPMLGALPAILVAVVLPIVLVHFFGYESKSEKSQDEKQADAVGEAEASGGFLGASDAEVPTGDVALAAPLAGTVVPLSETNDPVFGSGLIGPGVAIRPSGGRVQAPAAGVVVALPESHHAVGIRLDSGVELLVHVGIDTVKLAGAHFTPRAKTGQRVTAGEVVLEFDGDAIAAAGYSLITPVVVTNLAAEQTIEPVADGTVVAEGDPLLTLRATAGQPGH